jgi:endonuclease YncB( thermonuclease family)
VTLVLAVVAALWVWWSDDRPASRSEGARVAVSRSGVGGRALDGDTLLVDSAGEEIRVRIFGIDSPERGQPFADVARRRLGDLIERRRLLIEPIEHDRLGRLVARLRLEDGRDVAGEMLAAGLAWHFTRYSSDQSYAAAEARARSAKQGLWQDREPVPPWEWRRAHPVQAR